MALTRMDSRIVLTHRVGLAVLSVVRNCQGTPSRPSVLDASVGLRGSGERKDTDMTYQEQLIAGLKKLGYVEDKSDKSKYTALKKPGGSVKLFVGKYGALRKGECASRSISLGDPSHKSVIWLRVLQAGERFNETDEPRNW